ncbi:MAG: hypothetical protein ACYC35_12405 [Pirellulales bacterium]
MKRAKPPRVTGAEAGKEGTPDRSAEVAPPRRPQPLQPHPWLLALAALLLTAWVAFLAWLALTAT